MCAEDDAVVIEVGDNGVGMDGATRQCLFEPFFTTKDADRGTGLSITYAIFRNHDGQITVESEQGVGTTFKVMLPVVEKAIRRWTQINADEKANCINHRLDTQALNSPPKRCCCQIG